MTADLAPGQTVRHDAGPGTQREGDTMPASGTIAELDRAELDRPEVGSECSRHDGRPGAPAGDAALRSAVARQRTDVVRTNEPEPQAALRLSWRPRHVLLLTVAVGLVGCLAYVNRHAMSPLLWRAQLQPAWAAVALAGMMLTLAGNAWNLQGASPVRLRFWPTFAAQLAGSLVRIVSPAAVGAAAVNVQYLRRAGVGRAASVGTVSVAQSIQFVLALVLLPPVAIAVGADAALLDAHGARIAGYVAAGLVVAGVAAVIVVRRSPLLEARFRLLMCELTRSLRAMASEPRRAVVSVGGALLITAGLVTALWSAVHAFGGTLGVLTAAGVLLLGTSAGNAIPVPGGLGSVDAALVAALTATGTRLSVALPAVALFRLVTLWMLLPAGIVSLGMLRRRGQL